LEIQNPNSSTSEQTEDQVDNSEDRLQPTDVQDVADHRPSPDTYENALHGLLALGSRVGFDDGLSSMPREQEDVGRCASTYFETASGSLYEIDATWTIDTVGENGVGDEWVRPSSVPDFSSSAEPLDVAPHSLVLELLTYYRYHIAPWVSISS
jgi:hypothetical protein